VLRISSKTESQFKWEGVTQYMSKEAIDNTLKYLKREMSIRYMTGT